MEITDFRGEYSFLSNFYKKPINYEGNVYPCAENAFQAQKCGDESGKIKYTKINNPLQAKMIGKKEKLPEDWDEKSVVIMENILREKFKDPILAQKLIETGDAIIIEGNYWHDNKWGKCSCASCQKKESKNYLGNIIMKIRSEIGGSNDYICRLNMVYDKYYCQEDRKCIFFEDCKKNVEYHKDGVETKYDSSWAQVGELYGKEKGVPRIVVVGIEGLSGRGKIEQPSDRTAVNAHYNGVKYLVSYLLADFLGKEEKPTKVTNDGVSWVDDALCRYTLSNLYRCAFVPKSKPEKSKGLCHSFEMQKNCICLLIDEIYALKPDIVVVQASSNIYSDSMRNAMNREFSIRWVPEFDNNRAGLGYGKNSTQDMCFINTIHGANGGFKAHDYLHHSLNPLLDKAIEWYKNRLLNDNY